MGLMTPLLVSSLTLCATPEKEECGYSGSGEEQQLHMMYYRGFGAQKQKTDAVTGHSLSNITGSVVTEPANKTQREYNLMFLLS